ncbi:unnamed protein product [Phytomonas sp. EM1]|nr:unnamed protein product [Phytomonas sp. EM1]|eukprot:CCW63292.1 unnamed protein product [Phytomonas sp. isolate EM1]
MVLTGCIPNHPKGMRSRVIKELWYYTNHLKTLNSRIRLGTAYATGAQEFPKSSQVAAAMNKEASSKPIKVVSPAKHRVKKASKPISLKAPSNYEADPFLATYKVLMKYVPNKKADARMRAISKAWMRTDISDGKDRRTPEQRIQAVANELAIRTPFT